jgi:hypothetical protein
MVIDLALMPAALQARSCEENSSGRDGSMPSTLAACFAGSPCWVQPNGLGVHLTHAAQVEIGKPKSWQGAAAQNSTTDRARCQLRSRVRDRCCRIPFRVLQQVQGRLAAVTREPPTTAKSLESEP